MQPVILLGLGFTTRRLAKRLLASGQPVFAAVRNPERFADLRALGVRFTPPPEGATLVHTVPPLPTTENDALRDSITGFAPQRIVYISSTAVYGNQPIVDEDTLVNPSEDKGHARINEELWLQQGPWQTLILRAAAIYGPNRGVHTRVREGHPPRTDPKGITSRIHAEDLAALLAAATQSNLTGAWPVADAQPCSTAQLAEWCAKLLRTQLAKPWHATLTTTTTTTNGRTVNSQKIRALLGVELLYPGYESGTLACLAEEAATTQHQPTKQTT